MYVSTRGKEKHDRPPKQNRMDCNTLQLLHSRIEASVLIKNSAPPLVPLRPILGEVQHITPSCSKMKKHMHVHGLGAAVVSYS